jgi:CheY-like chemotaxis protein
MSPRQFFRVGAPTRAANRHVSTIPPRGKRGGRPASRRPIDAAQPPLVVPGGGIVVPDSERDSERAIIAAAAASREGPKTHMKTIVVVDDEYGLADVLASTFFDIGYIVHTAADGVQGLEIMAEHPPDLVILDFTMPLLDGPGVLSAMKGDPMLSSVPVVLISAMPESVVSMRCSGYVTFLRKPFDFDAILGAVLGSIGDVQ